MNRNKNDAETADAKSRTKRDLARDTRRDHARDLRRDDTRDTQRDEARDTERDAERDEARDHEHADEHAFQDDENEYQDENEPFNDAAGGQRTDTPFFARDELLDAERDGARDAERDEDRDAERDELRDSERDDVRDATRDRRRDELERTAAPTAAYDDVSLIVEMAEQCLEAINAWNKPTRDQPKSLRLEHLGWMCTLVVARSATWKKTKLHRWIGFIQAGMIANQIMKLEEARRMFDDARKATPHLDQDLLDHLDADNGFELDIGGQG